MKYTLVFCYNINLERRIIMNYIIEIDRIINNGNCIGYIGIEYKTGIIRYFTHYSNNLYYSDTLFEIYNPKDLERYSLNYKREYSDRLPIELKSLLKTLIQRHKKFNLDNSFPIDMLEYNEKYLSIQYDWYLKIFGSIATYTPLENKIDLNITKDSWKNLGENQKKKYNQVLLHEVGHMKVSRMIIDKTTFQVYTKTGFDTSIYQFQPIFLKNGDIFLKYDKLKSSTNKYKILEEIINELECMQIDSSYVLAYPNFGREINELCDGKLLFARYTNGVEEYYDSLNKIINSKDLADELLERILDVDSNEINIESNKTKVLEIINRYKRQKYK